MADVCSRLAGQPEPSVGVKGSPVQVFSYQTLAAISDKAVDCRRYNAVSVEVQPSGVGPSATVKVLGSSAEGGVYTLVPDPNAVQVVTSSIIFDVVVGSPWVKVQLEGLNGSFVPGQGFTVVVTPYVSPGQSRIDVSVQTEPSGDGTYSSLSRYAIDVGTVSTLVLNANTARKYAVFVNDSDAPIYLALGHTAVVSQDIRLNASGGAYEMDAKEGNLYRGAVYAIHGATGTKRLVVCEGT